MSEKTLDTEIRYYEDGTQATAENLNKPLEDLAKTGQYMSQAQFEKEAETNRGIYAGSGFVQLARTQWGGTVNDIGPLGTERSDSNQGLFTIYDKNHFKANVLGFDWNNQYLDDLHRTKYNINGINLTLIAPAINDDFGSTGKVILDEAPTMINSTNGDAPADMKQGEYVYDSSSKNLMPEISEFNGVRGGNLTINGSEIIIDSGDVLTWNGALIPVQVIKGNTYKFTYNILEKTVNSSVWYACKTELSSGSHSQLRADEVEDVENEGFIFTAYDTGLTYVGFEYVSKEVGATLRINDMKIECIDKIFVKTTKSDSNTDKIKESINFEPRERVARQDFVFLEMWHEKINDKGVVYPFGSVQYKGPNTDGLTGIASGIFNGSDTYSLFSYDNDEPGSLVGNCYIWENLTPEQKNKFASNAENNIYISEDNVIQVRYRFRYIKDNGLGYNSLENLKTGAIAVKGIQSERRIYPRMNYAEQSDMQSIYSSSTYLMGGGCTVNSYLKNNNFNKPMNGVFKPGGSGKAGYKNLGLVVPIALIQRRNQGAFDPIYNPDGTSKFNDGKLWWETEASHNNIMDCFLNADNGSYLGISGRPDGLFYDIINQRDVNDLRKSAEKILDNNTYLEEQLNLAGRNEIRNIQSPEETKIAKVYGSAYTSSYSQTFIGPNFIPNISEYKDIYTRTSEGTLVRSSYIDLYNDSRKKTQIHWNDVKGNNITNILPKMGEDLFFYSNTPVKYNHSILSCDVVGDLRKLEDRVTYTTTGSSQVIDIKITDYILKDGEYFKANIERLNIDLNTDDFTNTTNWTSKGTDGNKLGLPASWREHGKFYGTPSSTLNGESVYLEDLPRIAYSNQQGVAIRLNEKANDIYSVIYTNTVTGEVFDGFRKWSQNGSASAVQDAFYSGKQAGWNWTGTSSNSSSGRRNTLYLGVEGYTVVDGEYYYSKITPENISEWIIQIFYKTSAKYIPAANTSVIAKGSIMAPTNYNDGFGTYITGKLISKPLTHTASTYKGHIWGKEIKDINLNSSNLFIETTSLRPSHDTIDADGGSESVSGNKVFPYLTEYRGIAQLQFLYKEMKWDEEPGKEYWTYTQVGNIAVNSDTPFVAESTNGVGGYDATKILGQTGTSGRFMQLVVSDIQHSGSWTIELETEGGAKLDITQLFRQNAVFVSNGRLKAEIPIPTGSIVKVHITMIGSETIYVDRLAFINNKTNYNGWGDDNYFNIQDYLSLVKDDNDKLVACGMQRAELYHFLDYNY